MYPNHLVIAEQHKQFQREAAHDQLVRFVQEGQPTLWQRLRARLSVTEIPAAPVTPISEPIPYTEAIAVRQ